MKRSIAVLFGILSGIGATVGPAAAAEVPYFVTIAGRPLDARHPGARDRGGRLFINVVRAVRAFNGLLTFAPGLIRITVAGQTIVYHVGKTTADQGEQSVHLIAAPFVENGDIFVPLGSFAAFVSAGVTLDRDRHMVDLEPGKS